MFDEIFVNPFIDRGEEEEESCIARSNIATRRAKEHPWRRGDDRSPCGSIGLACIARLFDCKGQRIGKLIYPGHGTQDKG